MSDHGDIKKVPPGMTNEDWERLWDEQHPSPKVFANIANQLSTAVSKIAELVQQLEDCKDANLAYRREIVLTNKEWKRVIDELSASRIENVRLQSIIDFYKYCGYIYIEEEPREDGSPRRYIEVKR